MIVNYSRAHDQNIRKVTLNVYYYTVHVCTGSIRSQSAIWQDKPKMQTMQSKPVLHYINVH